MPANFETSLRTNVSQIAKKLGISKDKAFLIWFAKSAFDLTEDEALEAVSIEGANDKGLDFFFLDADEGKVVLGQAKYSSNLKANVKEAHLSSFITSLDWLASPEALRKDGKAELAEVAEDYLKAITEGYSVELWFIYPSTKKTNIEKKIQVYNSNPDNVTSNRVIRHYHLASLKDLWEEVEGGSQRISEAKIDIAGGKSMEFTGSFGDAVTVSLPASSLVSLYKKHGDRLFDRNIRLHLGARKGSVNAGIMETLANAAERPNFWAYNNGITIICDKYNVDNKNSIIELENFSVVNGCQTTVSLYQSGAADGDISVLARVIAAPAEIVDNIITYNNSQNPIRTWDIASQDKTQRRLKDEFERLEKPYIYLTRRGSRPKSSLAKYRDKKGKLRQIRIDEAGQFCAAYRSRPVLAYKNKGQIFKQFRDEIFPPDVSVLEVLFACICGEVAREAVQAKIAKGDVNEIRLLKKGGALFVVAIMSRIIKLRNGATFMTGLGETHILSPNMRSKLAAYATYAIQKYIVALEDEAGEKEMFTLIRSPEFFDKVAKRVERQYATDAMAKKWLSEALPQLAK